MDLSSTLREVSVSCLRGLPVPADLKRLWEAELADDGLEALDLELLESPNALELGYGEEDARLSGDVGANVKAHRRVFECLGFFAADADGGFLAFHLEYGDQQNPPVVHLDSEGQYRWLGACLGEALVTLAEESEDEDVTRAWLDAHDVSTKAPLGVDVAALPDLGAQHARLYDECRGKKGATPTLDKGAERAERSKVEADNPATWIGASGARVQALLKELLPAKEKNRLGSWMATDEAGRVKTVWLARCASTEKLQVKTASFGMSRASLVERLGKPTKEGAQWVRYDAPKPTLHFEFKDGVVSRMTLMAEVP